MRANLRTGIAAAIVCLTFAGCESAEQGARARLTETFADMGAAIADDDLVRFTSHYSSSPLHLPPGAPVNSTRDQVASFLADKLDLYVIEDEPRIRFSDDASMAYVFGYYTTKPDPARDTKPIRGRFVTIWQRNELDDWECVVDIWNSDDPRFAHL